MNRREFFRYARLAPLALTPIGAAALCAEAGAVPGTGGRVRLTSVDIPSGAAIEIDGVTGGVTITHCYITGADVGVHIK